MRAIFALVFSAAAVSIADGQQLRVFANGELPSDSRTAELRNLNSYFPFQQVDMDRWPQRQAEIKRRILLSQGLWPLPSKADLNAVVHGRVERDDYVVDRVYFESIPGHFVTGSLYRPKGKKGPYPAVLSPHGHWRNGRFYDAGEAQIKRDLENGAEKFAIGGRFPIQARAVQLARMGCLVFVYDMTGYADSIQIGHRPQKWSHLDREHDWGFFSDQAELRLQNMMGLQTWNSIRAIDFLLELDDIDPDRIGVTGASGGGTQSMIIAAIDDRIAAAMPCVMVSTSMQGGCTCENAPYLRIDQGNIDIAAATAPRPLGLTAADDWTVELETKGYPSLRELYTKLGCPERLTAAFNIQFKHNYNHVNRTVMYGFFNRHFDLGYKQPIQEGDFVPLTREEATVWTDQHPAPSGDAIGDPHEVRILQIAAKDSEERVDWVIPDTSEEIAEYRRVVGGAWETILGRKLSDVGELNFTTTQVTAKDGFQLTLGTLDHAPAGEQLPITKLRMVDGIEKGIVIWITDRGKSGLLQDDRVAPAVAEVSNAGYTVLSADLFGQGEFLKPGDGPLEKQRMWYQRSGEAGWERFSGYTYGYNHPLFVKRVHDLLSLIKYANSQSATVHLVGLGKQAGTIAIAGCSQAVKSVTRTFVDTRGFRFQSLTAQDDPMFVPGAVKYLGVDGLLSLCVPASVDVVARESDVVQQVMKAADATVSIRFHPDEKSLQAELRQALQQ